LIRLRGSLIAISTFFAIVSLYMVIDQRPVPASSAGLTTTTTTIGQTTTIPADNRLCGLAQHLAASLPQEQTAVTRAMQDFYTEVATFTEGDVQGDFIAASRFYTEVNNIGAKANWDVNRIVSNNDGARWRALMIGTPTGVQESRQAVRDLCRTNLPDPPSIEVDYAGRITDPILARLLAPADKEIIHLAPPPETAPDQPAANPSDTSTPATSPPTSVPAH
jgi:hypothetical protein